ncbi:MAG TPA: S8 family serine peptidase [Mycobacteriales bacterium]|nr:S8 family serine peptidase [Mycobacteriales bacterium]
MRRVAVASVGAVLATAAALCGSAAPAAGSGPRAVADRTVIVTVRPGTRLPLAVPGVRVRAVFSRVSSEVVSGSASALSVLVRDPRVAGMSPNWSGRVTGWTPRVSHHTAGVLAADALGGDAGRPGVGAGVSVALLDTGVNDTPALNRASGRLVDGIDVCPLTTGGTPVFHGPYGDGYGHGTFIASLIAGGPVPGSHGDGVGVAPAAHIVDVKVANSQGQTSLLAVLAGMNWVAAHASTISLANLSLSVTRPTSPAYGADPLTTAVDDLRADGVLVVAAVGNTPGQVGDPGMDPQALTAGAADTSGYGARVAPFSGSGSVDGITKPDVVAPGVHMLSEMTPSTEIAQQNPNAWRDGLFLGSGTSEATAVTTGVAAAYLSAHPGSTPLAVKTAIRTAAVPIDSSRGGAGLVSMGNRWGAHHPRGFDPSGEAGFDQATWTANSWLNGAWVDWLASSWSASSWSASSWSASSWSASSWSASSWSASSWSASSWSASSWSASSWSDAGWGDTG